ncbi:MAG: hypothetical protein R2747_05750 [Pyrinomonadaceae bacterium]
MKKLWFSVFGAIFCLTVLGVFLTFYRTGSAQKNAQIRWEYGSIVAVYSFSQEKGKLNQIFGMVEICTFRATGCQRSEIKHELDYGDFLQERGLEETIESRKLASQKASEVAFQKALFQMGNEGWELVSDPKLDFGTVDIDYYNKYAGKSYLFLGNGTGAVYFKRVKTQ